MVCRLPSRGHAPTAALPLSPSRSLLSTVLPFKRYLALYVSQCRVRPCAATSLHAALDKWLQRRDGYRSAVMELGRLSTSADRGGTPLLRAHEAQDWVDEFPLCPTPQLFPPAFSYLVRLPLTAAGSTCQSLLLMLCHSSWVLRLLSPFDSWGSSSTRPGTGERQANRRLRGADGPLCTRRTVKRVCSCAHDHYRLVSQLDQTRGATSPISLFSSHPLAPRYGSGKTTFLYPLE